MAQDPVTPIIHDRIPLLNFVTSSRQDGDGSMVSVYPIQYWVTVTVICLISCLDVDLMTAWNTINTASNLALLNPAMQPKLKSNKKAPPGAKYISQNDKLSLYRIKHKYLHKLFTITFCPFI